MKSGHHGDNVGLLDPLVWPGVSDAGISPTRALYTSNGKPLQYLALASLGMHLDPLRICLNAGGGAGQPMRVEGYCNPPILCLCITISCHVLSLDIDL
jgi:hypothetical protein